MKIKRMPQPGATIYRAGSIDLITSPSSKMELSGTYWKPKPFLWLGDTSLRVERNEAAKFLWKTRK